MLLNIRGRFFNVISPLILQIKNLHGNANRTRSLRVLNNFFFFFF